MLPKRLIAAHLRVSCLLSGCCALELVAVVVGEHWVAPSQQVEALTRALEAGVIIARYQNVFQVQERGRRVPNIDLENLFVSSVFAVKMSVQVLVLSNALLDLQAHDIARDKMSQDTKIVSVSVLFVSVASLIARLFQLQCVPTALGTDQGSLLVADPPASIVSVHSFPCAGGILAAPHLSCVVEDVVSAFALGALVDACVSTLP